MGWKGTLRSMQAAGRRAQRDAEKRQRALERQEKLEQKEREKALARFEVEEYEAYVESLISVHKKCVTPLDWWAISQKKSPKKPVKADTNEEKARRKLSTYTPGFFDKLLKRVEKKRQKLTDNIYKGKRTDDNNFKRAVEKFKNNHGEWIKRKELAQKVISGDIESYVEVLETHCTLQSEGVLGTDIKFEIGNIDCISADLHIHQNEVIPEKSKYLLKSGKLSTKNIPKGQRNELFQDHICSAVIRVAREMFAILPVKTTIVNAIESVISKKTGHPEDVPIVSVAFDRKTLDGLNYEYIDPSDSLENFKHNMSFKKTTCFKTVEKVHPTELGYDWEK